VTEHVLVLTMALVEDLGVSRFRGAGSCQCGTWEDPRVSSGVAANLGSSVARRWAEHVAAAGG
jgi:hypothetical protein